MNPAVKLQETQENGAMEEAPPVSPVIPPSSVFLSPGGEPWWEDPRYSENVYRRRLFLSVGASVLLNFLFLWAIFAADINRLTWFGERPKPKPPREVPNLVLVRRQVPPPERRARTFQETDPSQAVKDKPKDAAFYSEHNTVATQTSPTAVKSADIPKADGMNTRTMATETVLPVRSSPPPQPAFSSAQPAAPGTASPTPQKTPPRELPKIGEYAFLKNPPPSVRPSPAEETGKASPRPASSTQPSLPQPTAASNREVVAAMSKLDGGVNRVGRALAFNSAESPFATYDKKVIGKIGVYWQYLVANRYYGEIVGEVEITFKLMASGKVTELRVARNTANTVLAGWCIQAIEESAPFAPFPESIRTIVGDHREGSVTFAY